MIAEITAKAAVAATAPAETVPAAEINRIEAQLSTFLSHVEGHYDAEVAKIKSAYSYVRDNLVVVIATIALSFVAGLITAQFA
jgi:hypothetical protein